MGMENNVPNLQKPNLFVSCCTFYIFEFNRLKGFNNFVFKSVTTDPVICVFHGEYCSLMYGKFFYHRIKHLQYTPDNSWVVLVKCYFVLDKSLKSP